ncbi:L-threonine aldolase [Azorhizobium oxalatiphilum]|uniref:L-threonine aldolase n=1 Tax=Azorhizobium oxalatiphilum TaxID=980631 RepID=A0A917C9G9_9HYPH|nr:beta-eliminating lyase-related protein [Azorhizobium oxalatiphilum]GGF78161.1 L-threonine aldolase [Azorhizobium oxalatiphilum]
MEFGSDNVAGVHPAIFAAMQAANTGPARSYGADPWTERAVARLREIFETDLTAFLVATGTGANALALSAVTPPFGTVFCHREAHINTDECGAPELFTGGAKLTALDGPGCKLTLEALEQARADFVRGFHQQLPAAVSITQATELGQVYEAGEVAGIGAWCRAHGLRLHMDGARFANALVATNASAAELTWKAGVDVLSFGATKNGALAAEAIVFFDAALAEQFRYRLKRGAQVISKGRFLGAQMLAYLEDDLWLSNARHANAMAARLAAGLAGVPGVRLPLAVPANEAFVVLSGALHARLQAAGAHYHLWPGDGAGRLGPDEVLARFVCAFLTTPDEVDGLIAAARG